MKRLLKIACASLAVVGFTACTTSNKTAVVGDKAIQSDMEKAAEQRGDHLVSRVTFDKGKAELTNDAREELRKAIDEAKKRGQIDNVTVAVWSDMEYPGKDKNARLPEKQVELAKDRAENIEDYLGKELRVPGRSVKVHNMGKKPSMLSEIFNTEDEEVKAQLTAQGMAPTEDSMLNGAASSALIFIKMKE